MTRSIAAVILLSVSVSLATPVSIEAQLGGLIKKKVKEAIKKPETPPKTDDAPAAGPAAKSAEKKNDDPTGFGSAIIEITQPTFDQLMRAMQMEIDMQAVLKKEIARYGTHKEYEACKIRVGESPEGKKTMDRMYNPPKDIKAEDYLKLQAKVVEDMDALTKKGCPLDPSYWGPTRIAQSLDSIREKAAESITIASSLPASSFDVAHLRFETSPFVDGGFTFIHPQLYGIALERIDRLCEYKGFGAVGVTTVDTATKKDSLRNPRSGAPLKIPGIGQDIYWMWTATEVGVINSPNCRRYYILAKQLMA